MADRWDLSDDGDALGLEIQVPADRDADEGDEQDGGQLRGTLAPSASTPMVMVATRRVRPCASGRWNTALPICWSGVPE